MDKILRSEPPAQEPAREGVAERLGAIILVAGLMLSIAGWVDVALLWIPPRLGHADWEFGVIAQSLDAMPLPTMGLMLLAVATLLRGRRTGARALAAVFLAVTIWLLACAVVFALDLPQAASAAARDARLRPGITLVVLKAAIYFLSYVTGFGSAAIIMNRRARRLPSGRSA